MKHLKHLKHTLATYLAQHSSGRRPPFLVSLKAVVKYGHDALVVFSRRRRWWRGRRCRRWGGGYARGTLYEYPKRNPSMYHSTIYLYYDNIYSHKSLRTKIHICLLMTSVLLRRRYLAYIHLSSTFALATSLCLMQLPEGSAFFWIHGCFMMSSRQSLLLESLTSNCTQFTPQSQ
jgi:hypothetical protein